MLIDSIIKRYARSFMDIRGNILQYMDEWLWHSQKMCRVRNSSPPGQMAAISQTIFSNAFSWMICFKFVIEISLKFVSYGTIYNNPALV